MNKEINVYELLGLIKDGKAPRIIRIFEDLIYVFDEIENFYYNNGSSLYRMFYNLGNALEEKVEILEEDKPIIEKLNLDREPLRGREVPRAIDYLLEGRINEIIEFLSRKEDK